MIFTVAIVVLVTIALLTLIGVTDWTGALFYAFITLVVLVVLGILTFVLQSHLNQTHTTSKEVHEVVYYEETNTYQVDTGTYSITVEAEYATPGTETLLHNNERYDNLIFPWDMPPILKYHSLTYVPKELDIRNATTSP